MKSATTTLRSIFQSPSFCEFFSDGHPVDMMDEDAISDLSVRMKLSLTVWDFVLPLTPSLPAEFGVSSFLCNSILENWNCFFLWKTYDTLLLNKL